MTQLGEQALEAPTVLDVVGEASCWLATAVALVNHDLHVGLHRETVLVAVLDQPFARLAREVRINSLPTDH